MAFSRFFLYLKVDPPREGHAVQIHVRIRRIRKDGCFRRRHLSIFHLFSIEAMNLQSFFMKEGEGVPLEATKFRVSCPLPGKKDRPEAMHIGLDAIITGRKPILHLYQDL